MSGWSENRADLLAGWWLVVGGWWLAVGWWFVAKTFSPASRARLTRHDLGRFPDDTLFDRLARAICEAGCLPRKELYEAWEVARRTRRIFRGGRVLDIA